MIEQTTAIRNFEEGSVTAEQSVDLSVLEAFNLQDRNWNSLIDSFNQANKKKFPFTALQCAQIISFVKKGQPVRTLMKALGVSQQRYTFFVTKASELEEQMERLASKESLTDEEYEQFQASMRHPLRLLLSDINRAEGVSDLADFARFNEWAEKMPEIGLVKMKAKHRDYFNEGGGEHAGVNVQINLGGDFIKDI